MKTKGNIYLFLGVSCELYFIGTIIFGGIVTFAQFYLALGLLLITLGLYQRNNKKDYLLLRPGMLKTVIKLCFSLGIVSIVIIESLIIQSAITKNKQKSDYLVILGAGIRGEVPSTALFQRLYSSLEYIKINPTVKIVVTGGQGSGESITEAEAMKRFLMKNGVSEDMIIKEEKSTDTFQNMKFTSQILNKLDKKDDISVTIVTNNFHVLRAKFLARRQGLRAYGYPAPLHPMLVPTCFAREYLAVINSFLFDK